MIRVYIACMLALSSADLVELNGWKLFALFVVAIALGAWADKQKENNMIRRIKNECIGF